MTYQEVIDNIMALGFSDEAEMEEFEENGVLNASINRAISIINLDVPGAAPRNKEYTFSADEADTEVIYIDMESVDETFMEFADTAMLYMADGSDNYVKFNDFDIINDSTIIFDPTDYAGDFRVLYKAEHEIYTGTDEQKASDIPLARKVHHLVPLLAGYYVWLEDEPTKAAQYYNLYEQRVNEIVAKSQTNKPRMRVLAGGM